jgi:ribosomal protein S18 acetylase RimI-like enzyme
MTIRRIKKSDSNQLFETGNRRFDSDQNGNRLTLNFYFERDRSGKYESYVLEDNGQIVGVLCLQKQSNSLYVSRLGIHKNHHRKGHGAQLLKFTI